MAQDAAEKLLAMLGQTHIPLIATANATDLATAEALANANKSTLNTLITELQNAGILAAS